MKSYKGVRILFDALIELVLLTMMPTGHGSVFKNHAEVENYKQQKDEGKKWF